MIETARLRLRSPEERDAEQLGQNSRQPVNAHFLSDMVFETTERARGWVAWQRSKSNEREPRVVRAIERKSDRRVVGLVGVVPKRELGDEIELFYAVADDAQNNGYATEACRAMIWWAFERAGVDVLSGLVKPENKASRRVLEKLGFVYCDTRALAYDGGTCAFDYFRLYHLDTLPSPEWDEKTLYTPEPMGQFFDARAGGYNAHMLADKNSYERLTDYIQADERPLSVLDLGCGTGLELAYVWRQLPNAHITCVDVSRGMLDILEERYADRREQLTVVEASYTAWPYPREAFDMVISCNTMHHFLHDRKRELYRRIRDALKPGGFYFEDDFIVDAAMSEQYKRRFKGLTARLDASAGEYHIDIPLTITEQTMLLSEAGFQRVELLYECIRPRASGAILRAWK